MSPGDRARAQQLDSTLQVYESTQRALPGIRDAARRKTFVEQLTESIRRIKYITLISTRTISPLRADPTSDYFDPLKAALLHKRHDNIDEAFWLVFLSVHFGRHRRGGWRLCRDVYAGPGPAAWWTWKRITSDLQGFRTWLATQATAWKSDGVIRRFGNHHKYQSLDAWTKNGTGAAVESYVQWVRRHHNHIGLIADAQKQVGNIPRDVFEYLYTSMDAVASFGRTAKFDCLTMVGKMALAPIEPGKTYLSGATGPLRGARLLFADDPDATVVPPKMDRLTSARMEEWLVQLGAILDVGMQELEDALCNWQKSPDKFVSFRG
ncbi:hypothetical protein SOCE26_091030 [Sorangium cellulosum]|uniref:Alpha-glutamyl/putrescinyl thymine pyrophosphorylase clade 3 domain-containing protein n=1 Tax=Sorangium cellulosum TaxID=56 RepID=A0A2L0F7W7_SORCE|nr:hypothetical protein [Sorangium cellulosum]AUX47581.1 hypothetical protein SOCE26_091030 [Sorangium cellulosum]